MKLLLDTHTFLWFVTSDPQLSENALELIAEPTNQVLISPASYWEIAIKVSLGEYPLTVPFETLFQEGMDENDMTVLPIQVRHAAVLFDAQDGSRINRGLEGSRLQRDSGRQGLTSEAHACPVSWCRNT